MHSNRRSRSARSWTQYSGTMWACRNCGERQVLPALAGGDLQDDGPIGQARLIGQEDGAPHASSQGGKQAKLPDRFAHRREGRNNLLGAGGGARSRPRRPPHPTPGVGGLLWRSTGTRGQGVRDNGSESPRTGTLLPENKRRTSPELVERPAPRLDRHRSRLAGRPPRAPQPGSLMRSPRRPSQSPAPRTGTLLPENKRRTSPELVERPAPRLDRHRSRPAGRPPRAPRPGSSMRPPRRPSQGPALEPGRSSLTTNVEHLPN